MLSPVTDMPLVLVDTQTQDAPVRPHLHTVDTPPPRTDLQSALLFSAIEHFPDGLLILSPLGETLHRNHKAEQLLDRIEEVLTPQGLPETIWHLCETLAANQDLFPGEKIVLEETLPLIPDGTLRLRVQWFQVGDHQSCFLVTLEDLHSSTQRIAMAEAQRYGLTPREAEVWQLKRANCNYKDIAEKLYISVNTVKKHVKSIYAKRDQCSYEMPD